MLPEKPATEPRRKWHLLRWAFVLLALVGGWVVWKQYDFRQAVKEARERGWEFEYTDPVAIIRQDWRAAFRTETWNGAERYLDIHTGSVSERECDLIRRLSPRQLRVDSTYRRLSLKQLAIDPTFQLRDLSHFKELSKLTVLRLYDCPILTDIDALKDMKELTWLGIVDSPALVNIDALKELKNLTFLNLGGCTALTNVDALRELKAPKQLILYGCTGLMNVEGLHGLTGLKILDLRGCTGLTKEAVDAVKAALPKTHVASDYE